MSQLQNINIQDDNNFLKIFELISKNYLLFVISLVIAFSAAFLINYYSIRVYNVTSSILIKEDTKQQGVQNMGDFLNSSLFGTNQNFQNELWVIASSPVIENTVRNLDLSVNYYRKEGFQYVDAYQDVPFKIVYIKNHVQPIGARFNIIFQSSGNFQIKAEAKKAYLYDFEKETFKNQKENWHFLQNGKFGTLIETSDLSFMVVMDSTKKITDKDASAYFFEFTDIQSLTYNLKGGLEFNVVDKKATVIEIGLKTVSVQKGINIINELMDVYSKQNLDRKNHEAEITIDYIDKQLNEISDSLSRTEQNLQKFRSSNQLLNITEQATGITGQYRDLQNQMAELVTKKRYYDYVADYLEKNNDFSNMMIPASLGIQDQLLNTLMSELITAQAQRSNLIDNNQEKNPLVKKLGIQIENIKKTITENISSVRKTTDIAIDGMNHRIAKIQADISRLPNTERQLGGIERKFRLNDAIYNYLLEKRAEAKITKASNLPDDLIIEPAKLSSFAPISPKTGINYFTAFILGLVIPFGFLTIKNAFNQKVESQDNIERLTDVPILGKIMHNNKKTKNVMFEYPNSNIAESFRALRTNLEFYVRGHKKVIMITSCIEGEGKSFSAMNIAMSYAQMNRSTILLDFDLRKNTSYFNNQGESMVGLSSYLINRANLDDIIIKSTHENLDYIPSGPIPPNPVELLALEKTEKLIARLKENYDYIIIDTPPLAQVSDAYLLFEYTDVKIIIARYNFSIKKVFSLIMKDLKQKNITNSGIVLNDNRVYRDQYGYGYGYYNKGSNGKGKK